MLAALLLLLLPGPAHAAVRCDAPIAYAPAALANAASLDSLTFQPFRGATEQGWRPYAPLVAAAAGTPCAPETPAFAAALARWQAAAHLPADGRFTPADWAAIYGQMQARRPFVRVSHAGGCPPPPDPALLATAGPGEGYGGKPVQLLQGALAAWRRLLKEARRDPLIRADPKLLTIFSGYRSPDYQAALCARDGNCDGRRRASCSAHRTGYALDTYLGQAPGYAIDSSALPNRRALAASPAYLWLTRNAARFGFVNYAFEPWHWEWSADVH